MAKDNFNLEETKKKLDQAMCEIFGQNVAEGTNIYSKEK